jgi:hypothetical protein
MALRNQPYLPLYVQDFLTDEKLNACSASTQGIYIKIMCILHKSEEYGTLRIKEKDQQNYEQNSSKTLANDEQNFSKIKIFAHKLSKLITFTEDEIFNALIELVEEGVMKIDGDILFQKRMVKDAKVSEIRAVSGSKRTKNLAKSQQNSSKNPAKIQQNFSKNISKNLAKVEQNTENEIENEYENEYKNEYEKEEEEGKNFENYKQAKTKRAAFKPPELAEVQKYIDENGYSVDAEAFISFYNSNGWKVGKNNMKDWQAAVVTWEKRNKGAKGGERLIDRQKNVNDIWKNRPYDPVQTLRESE